MAEALEAAGEGDPISCSRRLALASLALTLVASFAIPGSTAEQDYTLERAEISVTPRELAARRRTSSRSRATGVRGVAGSFGQPVPGQRGSADRYPAGSADRHPGTGYPDRGYPDEDSGGYPGRPGGGHPDEPSGGYPGESSGGYPARPGRVEGRRARDEAVTQAPLTQRVGKAFRTPMEMHVH